MKQDPRQSVAQAAVVEPLRIADARRAVRHVFVRDLVLACSIGIHGHEREAHQRVRFNIDLAVTEGDDRGNLDDDIANVVCYEVIVDKVRDLVGGRHINLVETLAEEVAAMALEDRRVRSVRVRVEKLDVLPDATSVGVEIERFNPNP